MKNEIYPIAVVIVLVMWLVYMTVTSSWHLFAEFWPVSATMTLGSFVAGSTPEGGAAISFPVFTKVLDIAAPTARTFGLLIQSVGMMMAALFIFSRKIPVLPKVIAWVTAGGVIGQLLGTFWFVIPSTPTRVLFTAIVTTFGFALIISRWIAFCKPLMKMPVWTLKQKLIFLLLGVTGGIFAANTGSGIDMVTFIVLTLAFGIHEKIGTPTAVTIMGLNSVVGFLLRATIIQDIGISWSYALVAIPIVILGAPLGAWATSRVKRDWLIIFLLSLIGLELASTAWLIEFDRLSTIIAASAVMLAAVSFTFMLRYRQACMKDWVKG